MTMKDQSCWQLAHDCLSSSCPVALMVVVESSAGSPGRQGFKMVVAHDGRMAGTIGGGAMEYKFVRLAKELLDAKRHTPQCIRQNHDNEAPRDRSGMICAGHQVNVICPLAADDLSKIELLLDAHEDNKNYFLRLAPIGLSVSNEGQKGSRYSFSNTSADDWRYEECLGIEHTMYIVGGGHVGLALSRIMRTLDFYVVVFDHRADLHTLNENWFAHEKIVTPYEELSRHIVEDERNFVAVVSTTFKTDEAALCELIGKKLGYLGVMGSKAKIEHLLKTLRAKGASDEELKKLYAPIGLPIHSHTVEEIAVSIAAQIIKVRNDREGRGARAAV